MTRAKKKNPIGGKVAEVYQNAILEAAERVFGRHGFEAAKMADIAKEAGLASGTLYNYFESKVQIFQSLMDFRGDDFMEQFDRVLREPCDSDERLIEIVETVFGYFEKHRLMLRIFVQLGADSEWSIGRVSPKAADRHDRYLEMLGKALVRAQKAKVVRKDVPVIELVTIFSGIMNAFVRLWLRGGFENRLVDASHRVVALFLEGAGPK
jgi:TetR/AcrR family transcriptional regulator, fatty acid metabolism regulator protein